METKISVTGLYNFILNMDEARYRKYPIIEGCKTKSEALDFLAMKEAEGVNWL